MASSSFKTAKQSMLGRKQKNKTCTNCQSTFHQLRDLIRHEKNSKRIHCLHCDQQFCNNEHFQKHMRSIKRKGGSITDYEMPICVKSGYEDDPEFERIINEKRT